MPSEYDAMMKRKGKPYSDGHRAMYDTVGTLLRNVPASILDVGCGIGYGFEALRNCNNVKHYVGIDPDGKCIDFCQRTYDRHAFKRLSLAEFCAVRFELYDFVLCIEVFEHVPPAIRLEFLEQLRSLAKKNLFLSTPNILQHKHGVISPPDMMDELGKVGFTTVCVEHQWTVFYLAQ